jgi:hypothetical protein
MESGAMSGPASTRDLLASENRFVAAMRQLGYGRFEFLRIERGELILDPWPSPVRHVKFCAAAPAGPQEQSPHFELKKQVSEFFDYVRAVDSGEIRRLDVHNGLPFTMEVEVAGTRTTAAQGDRRC